MLSLNVYVWSASSSGMWNSPAVTGTLPPQLWAGFSFTLMGSRAVLIGSGGVGVVYGDVGVY